MAKKRRDPEPEAESVTEEKLAEVTAEIDKDRKTLEAGDRYRQGGIAMRDRIADYVQNHNRALADTIRALEPE